MTEAPTLIGKSLPRKDLREKLMGQASYTADLKLPGLLHAKILRSPHPHARILSIDTSRAFHLPGVHAILTPFNVPHGLVDSDLPILDTEVRYVGDEVAVVAADDEDRAEEALGLMAVEYEVLPFVVDPEKALRPDAPLVHAGGNLVDGEPQILERGDVEEGFAQADLVFEETYRTPCHSPAGLEPRAVLATWEGEHVTVWKSSRGVHADRARLAKALDLPPEQVRVIGGFLGGGFGNKDESRLASLIALLSKTAGRPVRVEYTRREEFVAAPTRHSSIIHLKIGVKRDGTVTAIQGDSIMDTGSYVASGRGVVRRAGHGISYLYTCPNVKYEGRLVYTNRPWAGSYRALGAPQGHFALETLMDRVAEALGIDALEFRLKNRVKREGQPGVRQTPRDQMVDPQPIEGGIPFSSYGLEECLRTGADAIGWRERRRRPNSDPGPLKRGLGMAMFLYRGGPQMPASDAIAEVRLYRNGTVQLLSGMMDVGEGATTVLSQLCAETLGVPYDSVVTLFADTAQTPNAGLTAGSSGTFVNGSAAVQAALELRAKVLDRASVALETTQGRLDIREGVISAQGKPNSSISLGELAAGLEEEYLGSRAVVKPGSTEFIVNSFGAHFAEVEVDTETGSIHILDYVAVHDSGRILNLNLAQNQVEGGISQALGFSLFEELVTDPNTGVTLNPTFLDHRSPTIMDYPPIRVKFVDIVDPVGPYGAKALGEPPYVPVAAVIANAVYNATGVWLTVCPMTPERVLTALRQGAGGL